jgi:hypothetical protein
VVALKRALVTQICNRDVSIIADEYRSDRNGGREVAGILDSRITNVYLQQSMFSQHLFLQAKLRVL